MSYLQSYVLAGLVQVMLDLKRDLNLSTKRYDEIVQLTVQLILGPIGNIIVVPLALIFWLYFLIRNVSNSIPDWITNGVDFVVNQVRPYWYWLINSVDDLNNIIAGLYNTVLDIANDVVNNVMREWWHALDFANWLATSAYDVLIAFISDPWGYIYNVVIPVLEDKFPGLQTALTFVQDVILPSAQAIISILYDPVPFVTDILRPVIDAVVAPFEPILDFIDWWRSIGGTFVLSLVSDPKRVILDLIMDDFIDWLLRLIARNW